MITYSVVSNFVSLPLFHNVQFLTNILVIDEENVKILQDKSLTFSLPYTVFDSQFSSLFSPPLVWSSLSYPLVLSEENFFYTTFKFNEMLPLAIKL